jgi:hypothetical protein
MMTKQLLIFRLIGIFGTGQAALPCALGQETAAEISEFTRLTA